MGWQYTTHRCDIENPKKSHMQQGNFATTFKLFLCVKHATKTAALPVSNMQKARQPHDTVLVSARWLSIWCLPPRPRQPVSKMSHSSPSPCPSSPPATQSALEPLSQPLRIPSFILRCPMALPAPSCAGPSIVLSLPHKVLLACFRCCGTGPNLMQDKIPLSRLHS